MRVRIRRTRLARALSKSGYCSRSQASALIAAGRIRVNGQLVRDPEFPVVLTKDRIAADGGEISAASKLYLMMNKPRGIVTTARDEKGRATVYSLLSHDLRWVAPVGRLDKATEGLLLLTNDSEWGARIASPEFHVPKTYHVQIATIVDQALLDRLSAGVRSGEGDCLKVKYAALVRTGKRNSWIEIVLDEGKNRQIRRLFLSLGIEVMRLVRIAIGTLQLGDLPTGKVRELTQDEKNQLDLISGLSGQPRA